MSKNLLKRGKIFYLAARIGGKRISKSLETTELLEAQKRARRLIKSIKEGKWELLEKLSGKHVRCITVGEFIIRYKELAAERERATGKPRLVSVNSNVWALVHVIEVALKVEGENDAEINTKVKAMPLNVLSVDLLEKYVANTVGAVTDELQKERRRRTAFSYVASVKSLFTHWVKSKMEEQLPELQKMLDCRPVESMRLKYTLPPSDLITKTITAARETLRKEKPDLYVAFLLCYDLGMRAGEAARAQWSWIVEQSRDGKPRKYMEIVTREGFQTKSRRGRLVPISASVYEHLMELKQPDDLWIVPGVYPTVREKLVKRELAGWMRGLGWDVHKYPKAAHELRKLIGSEWYTRFGVEVACNWLGHRSISTTFDYYADLTRHPEPIEI